MGSMNIYLHVTDARYVSIILNWVPGYYQLGVSSSLERTRVAGSVLLKTTGPVTQRSSILNHFKHSNKFKQFKHFDGLINL